MAERATLTLLSWNVHALPFWLAERQSERLTAVAEVVRELAPDVVLLQELWVASDARDLSEHLPAFRSVDNVGGALGRRRSGLLALVRDGSAWTLPDPWTSPEDADFHEFEAEAPDWKLWEGDGVGGKGVQRVRLQHAEAGPVVLYNTHLQAEYGDGPTRYTPIRRAQVDELTAFAEATSGGHPVVCAGDFNIPASESPDDPTGYDRETFLHLVETNGWVDLTRERRLACLARAEAWSCTTRASGPDEVSRWIDYVLTRADPRWRVEAREVRLLLNDGPDDPWSDHHGLYVELEVAAPALAWRPLAGAAAAIALAGPSTRRAWLRAAAAFAASRLL